MELLVVLIALVAALSLTRSKALLVALAGWAGGLVITWVTLPAADLEPVSWTIVLAFCAALVFGVDAIRRYRSRPRDGETRRLASLKARARRISPAVALLFLAPVCGELLSAHQTPLQFLNPVSFLLTSLPYGCGALLCRELTVRWGKSKLSLALLAIAYGLYEEGIVVRSLFNPKWGEESSVFLSYGHRLGVNWTYAEALVHFHVLISIMAGVLLAEALYPARRSDRWLGRRGIIGCALVLAGWTPVFVLVTHYYPGSIRLAGVLAVIAAAILLARLLPARPLPALKRAAQPVWFFLVGAVNMTAFFLIVFVLPEHGAPPLLYTVLFLIALDAATVVLLVRMSGNGAAWRDRHKLAWVAGLLAFFAVIGTLQDFEGFAGRSLIYLAAAYAFWKLWRSARERDKSLSAV